MIDSYNDPTLAIRPISQSHQATENTKPEDLDRVLTRQVVMVTTRDRLMIPPIAHFYQLVKDMGKTSEALTSQLVSR